MEARDELTSELEAALLRQIREVWRSLNDSHFRSLLKAPLFALHGGEGKLGSWSHESRTLTLSRAMCLAQPWGVVVEVLKHEMAHQYVHEIRGAIGEQAHGMEFREVCERLAIDGRAYGVPSTVRTPEEARIAERVAKLLALAESPNRNEAEAAMLAAQRLMLRHHLEAGDLARSAPVTFAHLGVPKARTHEAERTLSLILAKHFFVEVIWVPTYVVREAKRAHVLEVCGTESNVAIARYVHGYLTETAERLWREHKKAHGIVKNRDRRTFLSGVMHGVDERLSREKRLQAKEGLVWVKDGNTSAYLRKRHPYVRNVRYGGARRNDAYAEGRAAGRSVEVHRGVPEGEKPVTRLLPPGRR